MFYTVARSLQPCGAFEGLSTISVDSKCGIPKPTKHCEGSTTCKAGFAFDLFKVKGRELRMQSISSLVFSIGSDPTKVLQISYRCAQIKGNVCITKINCNCEGSQTAAFATEVSRWTGQQSCTRITASEASARPERPCNGFRERNWEGYSFATSLGRLQRLHQRHRGQLKGL